MNFCVNFSYSLLKSRTFPADDEKWKGRNMREWDEHECGVYAYTDLYVGGEWAGPTDIFNALQNSEDDLHKLGTETRFFGCPNIT